MIAYLVSRGTNKPNEKVDREQDRGRWECIGYCLHVIWGDRNHVPRL